MGHERTPANTPDTERDRPVKPPPGADTLTPRAQQLMSLQQQAGNRAVRQLVQRNETGLPDDLKSGVESLSGVSLDDVRVHYDSSRPRELGALAYTQGTDIHVAPGQERHLAHEAWHVVQQAEGRVPPTGELQGGVAVNDDTGLEREAATMGDRAAAAPATLSRSKSKKRAAPAAAAPVQRLLAHTSPIAHGDVTSVRKVGGKLVFILDGAPNNGIVVVKFESFGIETLARYRDRSAALRTIAGMLLQNVPGTAPLTPTDVAEIALINLPNGGQDLADLKALTAGVAAGGQQFAGLLPMKMENINVGQNVEDMIAAANQAAQQQAPAQAPVPAAVGGGGGRVRGPARGPVAPAVQPVVSPTSPVWREFGRMAAFDLLVSNTDRFATDRVNLQNVDLRGQGAGQQGVSLDIVDNSADARMDAARPWDGEAEFRDPTAWSQKIVGDMCDQLHVPQLYFMTVLQEFVTGFNAAKATLKQNEWNYRRLGAPQLGGRGQGAAGSHAYKIIAERLSFI